MTPEQFQGLERGDIVRNSKGDGSSWLVAGRDYSNGGVILFRHIVAHNAAEWVLATKSIHFTIEGSDEATE